ncbi:MAG: hypothetical protein AAF968_09910, partial [Pseudomonadota bacterium]
LAALRRDGAERDDGGWRIGLPGRRLPLDLCSFEQAPVGRAACCHQFSVTARTIFALRKLSFVNLLGAICPFLNSPKELSALQL